MKYRLSALLATFIALAVIANDDNQWNRLKDREDNAKDFKSQTHDFGVNRELTRDAEHREELVEQKLRSRLAELAEEQKPAERPAFLNRERVEPVKRPALTAERRQAIISRYDRDGDGALSSEEKALVRQTALTRMAVFLSGKSSE